LEGSVRGRPLSRGDRSGYDKRSGRSSQMAITASITMEAVKDLDLKAGDDASAIIKASDVIVGKD